MKKMSDDELIDALNSGQTGREIAEKYGYSRPQRISERIRELKDQGYRIRDTTSEASQGAGLQVSIPSEMIEDLDFARVDQELYYFRYVKPDFIEIEIVNEQKPEAAKMSRISESGDRMIYLTGEQLSDYGFESTDNIFVEKSKGNDLHDRIELKLSNKRVIEP